MLTSHGAQTTDFHFPDFPDQLRTLQAAIKKGGSNNADAELAHGDFYVTKHSNLADVQVVFHLAAVEQEVV